MDKTTLYADIARYELAAATAWVRAQFVENVKYAGPDGCWEWTGMRTPLGYGTMSVGAAHGRIQAHRLALHLAGRPVPGHLVTDHLCRNPPCVNPAHLDIVTQAVNNHRGMSYFGINHRKTHCNSGHEYTPENTARQIRGGVDVGRRCKECGRLRSAAQYRAKKLARTA